MSSNMHNTNNYSSLGSNRSKLLFVSASSLFIQLLVIQLSISTYSTASQFEDGPEFDSSSSKYTQKPGTSHDVSRNPTRLSQNTQNRHIQNSKLNTSGWIPPNYSSPSEQSYFLSNVSSIYANPNKSRRNFTSTGSELTVEGSGNGPLDSKKKFDDTEEGDDDDEDYDYKETLDSGSGQGIGLLSTGKPGLVQVQSNNQMIRPTESDPYYPFRQPNPNINQSSYNQTMTSTVPRYKPDNYTTSQNSISSIKNISISRITTESIGEDKQSSQSSDTKPKLAVSKTTVQLVESTSSPDKSQTIEVETTEMPDKIKKIETIRQPPTVASTPSPDGHNLVSSNHSVSSKPKHSDSRDYDYDDESDDDDSEDTSNFEDNDSTTDTNKTSIAPMTTPIKPIITTTQTSTVAPTIAITTNTPEITRQKLNMTTATPSLELAQNTAKNPTYTASTTATSKIQTSTEPPKPTTDYDDERDEEEDDEEEAEEKDDIDDDYIVSSTTSTTQTPTTSSTTLRPPTIKLEQSTTTTPDWFADIRQPKLDPVSTMTTTLPSISRIVTEIPPITTTTPRMTTTSRPVTTTVAPTTTTTMSTTTTTTTQRPIQPIVAKTSTVSPLYPINRPTTPAIWNIPTRYSSTPRSRVDPTGTRNTEVWNYDKSNQDDGLGLTRQIYDKVVEVYEITSKAISSTAEAIWNPNLQMNSSSFEPLLDQPLLFMLAIGVAVMGLVLIMMLLVYLVTCQIQPKDDDISIY